MSGPIELDADLVVAGPLEITAPPGGIGLASARLDLSAGFELPGVSAKAQRFGVDVAVSFSFTRRGNLLGGYLLVDPPTPRAPEVIAVSLDGPMPGGGYLEHSRETNTYRGAIGVDLGFVVVAGFASISPGDPVSVVAILSASFRPPIQLSFGFTLVGVGGVVGVNRGMDKDALQEATFSGAIGSMFFPRDPVAEAPAVLPALDRCFPVRPGDFFAGPMLKVGWGTPTIVSATVAVIAGTSGVAIFGRFAVSLPCEDVPFAVLQATVVGFFDAQGVSIFGSLVNSHVGPITIDGDACFVLTGGDNGTMALSVGGFHPQYKERPPGIKPMKRLRAELSPLPFASISIEGYCAVTSDSVQFGASIRMSLDLAVAAVEGSASFDALIYFSPFRFMVDFRGSLNLEVLGVRFCSIGLTAHISGPGRWLISGEVSVGILWWDVDVPIEIAWGDSPPEPLATERPLELLKREVGKPENWSPDGNGELAAWVVLVPVEADSGATGALSAVGGLTFVQQAIPLGRELTRLGGRRLPAPETASVAVNGAPPNLDRRFPAGLFFERNETELLSGQGLVASRAGVVAGAQGRVTGKAQPKNLDFEDLFLQPDSGLVVKLRSPFLAAEVAVHVAGGAAGRLRSTREAAVVAPTFAVVGR